MAAPAVPEPTTDAPPRGAKVERILKHCVFEIATGAWPVGHRLPSLRTAERLWSVNHLTVLRAYRRLEALGLAYSRPRSGFFVAEHTSTERARRGREALETLYDAVRERMVEHGTLSILGAFRYLARLAESRARRHPECAFVECTRSQAESHAREVEERLEVPCAALTLNELADRSKRTHLRAVMTTGFHRAEVAEAAGEAIETLTVAIELSPACAGEMSGGKRGMLFLALDADTAAHIAQDASEVLPAGKARVESRACTATEIDSILAEEASVPARRRRSVVLSPSLWSAADEALRADDRVHRLTYRIAENAWVDVATALGVPLGVT